MTSISKSADVQFSAKQLYDLVNDVEAYPQFLPWCVDSKILTQAENNLTASLSVTVGKIRQSFITQNTMQTNRRIDINLANGPFKKLHGHWIFDDNNGQACRIIVYMNFEFSNKLVKLVMEGVFSHVVNTLIDAFTERASRVYGRN